MDQGLIKYCQDYKNINLTRMMQTLHESDSLMASSNPNYESVFGMLQYSSESTKPRMTPTPVVPHMTRTHGPVTPTAPSSRKHSRSQSSDVHTILPPKRMASESDESQFTCIFSPSGTILFASPSIQTYLGMYPSEMIGVAIYDYLHCDDVERFTSVMNAVMTSGIARHLVYRLKLESNHTISHIYFEGLARPYVPDDNDQCQGITLMSMPSHQQQNIKPQMSHNYPSSGCSTPLMVTPLRSSGSTGTSPNRPPPVISNDNGSLATNNTITATADNSSLANSTQASDNGNLWLRRQVARMHKTEDSHGRRSPPCTLPYEMESNHLSVLTSGALPTPVESYEPLQTGVSLSPTSSYDLNCLATSSVPSATSSSIPSATFSVSPFDDDNTTASSIMSSLTSDQLHHQHQHVPSSANVPTFAYDDSWTNSGSITGYPPGGYASLRSYSYFDAGHEPSLTHEDGQSLQIAKGQEDESSYWDNTANSELISPQYSFGSNHSSSIKQHLNSYYMNAQQIRGKSYSLPGAFDAMGRPYQQYQHNTTKLANPGHIDFSGYSMSVKNKTKSLSDMKTSPMAPQQLSVKSRKKSKHNLGHDLERHICDECGAVESPEWRKGPKGPKTLCNACGLRWAKRTRKDDKKRKP